MNKERIEALADKLEEVEEFFDMSRVKDDCDSPFCIAGWAVALFYPNALVEPTGYVIEKAQEALGLSNEEASLLFMPVLEHADYTALPGEYMHVDGSRAARTLRRLAKTGKVDWEEKPASETLGSLSFTGWVPWKRR